jgi:hypothetical protein
VPATPTARKHPADDSDPRSGSNKRPATEEALFECFHPACQQALLALVDTELALPVILAVQDIQNDREKGLVREPDDFGKPPTQPSEPEVRITGRDYQPTTLVWAAIRSIVSDADGSKDHLMALHRLFQHTLQGVHGRAFCSAKAVQILRAVAELTDGSSLFLLLLCQIMTYTQTKDKYTVRQTHWMDLLGSVEKVRALSTAGKLRQTIEHIHSIIAHYITIVSIGQASAAAHFQVLIEETLKKIGGI